MAERATLEDKPDGQSYEFHTWSGLGNTLLRASYDLVDSQSDGSLAVMTDPNTPAGNPDDPRWDELEEDAPTRADPQDN